jgi:hypothetical protein
MTIRTKLIRTNVVFMSALAASAALAACSLKAPATSEPQPSATSASSSTGSAEPGVTGARQLTFPDRFIKAGEAYFSPDAKQIVFQAIEVPEGEESPADFYAMFVCDVVRDASGEITGVTNIRRVSPKGSANTCGWFHPTDPNRLLFASTVGGFGAGERDAAGGRRDEERPGRRCQRQRRGGAVDAAAAVTSRQLEVQPRRAGVDAGNADVVRRRQEL